MSQGFKWSTALAPDELWLMSDREILNRAVQSVGKVGVVLTLTLPNGEDVGVEVDKLNAENGSTFCNMMREYFDEWKAGKEAASQRKQRDREQQSILDQRGDVLNGDTEDGVLPVQETVQALETAVQGAASLEEEVLQRIADAEAEFLRLHDEIVARTAQQDSLRTQLKQLKQMQEIFNASKVLEEASESVREGPDAPEEGAVGDSACDAAPESDGSAPVERTDTRG